MTPVMSYEKGFSLIELLIVAALIAIIASIAMTGSASYGGSRLAAVSKQLYGDLQKIRVDAMTRNPSGETSRGFGIRFTSDTAYTIFEFKDANGDFHDNGGDEEILVKQITLPSGITVAAWISNGEASPANDVRIYDKLGITRTTAWSTAAGRTYILRLAGVNQARCVKLAAARVWEGVWSGSECNIQ